MDTALLWFTVGCMVLAIVQCGLFAIQRLRSHDWRAGMVGLLGVLGSAHIVLSALIGLGFR